MATIEKLPVNFQDDVLDTAVNEKRQYNLIDNENGTKSLEDVTVYSKVGSNFGAEQINQTNTAVNRLIDNTSNVDNTRDSEKSVLYANNAGHADMADSATHATTADSSTNSESSSYAETAKSATNANHAETADNANNAEHANTADSVTNDFVLINKGILTFTNNTCTIKDQRITEDSLADVYFTPDSEETAKEAVITPDTYDGELVLTAIRNPLDIIRATITVKVV